MWKILWRRGKGKEQGGGSHIHELPGISKISSVANQKDFFPKAIYELGSKSMVSVFRYPYLAFM